MSTPEIVEDVLAHFGKKGMRWGVRTKSSRPTGPQKVTTRTGGFKGRKLKAKGGSGFPSHADAVRARKVGQIGKKSGLHSLSNKDLQSYKQRLELESSVKRLNFQEKSAGKKFVAKILGQSANQQASEVTNQAASKAVKTTISAVTRK